MLLNIAQNRAAPRMAVIAYDMASPRRAQRVRRLLESVHHARQYSVFEVLLHTGELHGLIAELNLECDLEVDKLAVWWPRQSLRVEWSAQGYRLVSALSGHSAASDWWRYCGNFLVTYDVSNPDLGNAIAARAIASGVMVQRSVYWLRMGVHELASRLGGSARLLADSDRLWAYPLAGAHCLWRLDAMKSSLLPVALHHWFHERDRS